MFRALMPRRLREGKAGEAAFATEEEAALAATGVALDEPLGSTHADDSAPEREEE